ncbi:MAG: CRISPR-associated protein Cas4 [Planctomycetota bacterium]
MFKDADLLPLSGLQHLVFCRRQAGLIHVESQWADNKFTVEGSRLHEQVDQLGRRHEKRGNLVVSRGIWIRSQRLGLIGRADVVEFRRVECGDPTYPVAVPLPGRDGRWRPLPVEYKRGKPKEHRADEVQLCAQAMCIEEHFEIAISEGSLYYGQTKRRTEVDFDEGLRDLTKSVARDFHNLVKNRETPRAEPGAKCTNCSLLEICVPSAVEHQNAASRYIRNSVRLIARERS